jgi:hypothetical protein
MTVNSSGATSTAGVASSRAQIAGAIKQAANTTGTSFQYLLTTAKMESDFNPKAAASTSIKRHWLILSPTVRGVRSIFFGRRFSRFGSLIAAKCQKP